MGETRLTRGRQSERGSVLIIAMVALVALAGLGGFTALSVQGGVAAQSASRFQSVALYAAEAGVAAGMEFLRANIDPIRNWTAFVDTDNTTPPMPIAGGPTPFIWGNNDQPGTGNNPFSAGYRAWYQVRIYNNPADPGYSLPNSVPTNILDQDGRVTLEVIGYGPNGARVTLEVDVVANNADQIAGRPCPSYSQKGLSEDGAGRNDCLGLISTGVSNRNSPSSP